MVTIAEPCLMCSYVIREAKIVFVVIPVRFASTLVLALNEMTSNGWKHGGEEVEIGLQAHGDNVTLHVCDDGPGFPADFEPTTDANTGLELLTSLARYDLHGDVRFLNRPAGGGRVEIRFTLPTKGSGTTRSLNQRA